MTTAALGLVDFGSTFTKVRAVTAQGRLVASAQHRTTVETDVFDGLDAALEELRAGRSDLRIDRIAGCSSAGGGLRLAVVGLIDDLTAEAARQAALSAGARVLEVVSGGLADADAARRLLAGCPDIVLLVGGTDGGDRTCLLASARALRDAGAGVPVVVAGNSDAQPEAIRILSQAGVRTVAAANVMPAIETLAVDEVRDAIRELFITHVIGGKLAGSAGRLEDVVRMATPDAALLGVELLARMLAERGRSGGVLVVDVGGATTDVHSAAAQGAEEISGYKRRLLPQALSARTVEADLGVRWNAPGIVATGLADGVLSEREAAELAPGAALRAENPGYLPANAQEIQVDRILARVAIAISLRRHAGVRRITLTPDGAILERDGRDLSMVDLLIGTGGVLQHIGPADLEAALALSHRGREQRLLPQSVRTGIDRRYVIAVAGLLAAEDEELARTLLRHEIDVLLTGPEEGHVDTSV